MRIHPGLAELAGSVQRGAVAIGNFDGVHLGHRALFEVARRAARNASGPVCALTFEPHPARVLAPAWAPPLIAALPRKRELLAAAGVEELIEQPFDRAFASLSPDEFVELLLATGLVDVVVGHDFTYGKARVGNIDSLRRALEERSVRLHVVPAVTVNGLVVSSTKIREFILAGRVEAANILLGRPFDIDGDVVRGAGRGRKLGWPTANIHTTNELLPSAGVYAVRAQLLPQAAGSAAGAWLPGAANLGLNPTFRPEGAQAGVGARVMLEVHLFDLDQDLYGRPLRVEFLHRLRDERRFPGVEALKEQIARDVAEARKLLA